MAVAVPDCLHCGKIPEVQEDKSRPETLYIVMCNSVGVRGMGGRKAAEDGKGCFNRPLSNSHPTKNEAIKQFSKESSYQRGLREDARSKGESWSIS